VFDALQERLSGALDGLRGRGRLDAGAVDAVLSDIRLALLEADVNLAVVRGVVERLRERLVGADVAPGLDPRQHVVRAVDAELRAALGGEHVALDLAGRAPAVIVLAGLQGAGKTTVAGKLAKHLASKGRRPVLVACDLQRPAAVEQLRIVAAGAGVPVHAPVTEGDPVPVAREAIRGATLAGHDTVIIDTAGRLHVDEELLRQARSIVDVAHELGGTARTLFVIDAMVGQEAAAVARSFADVVGLDGVILSKLDGDARGGAALSVREVTGAPILFASIGERVEDLEAFHPDRMASRILGMGDMLTLIERAEQAQDLETARDAEQALLDGTFGLDDLLEQLQAVKRMGPLSGVIGMLPGMAKGGAPDVDDRQLVRTEAIIRSMTPSERRDPKVLNGRRRRRIAAGSGTSVPEINRLVKQFEQMQQLMRQAVGAAGRGKGGKGKGGKGGKGRKGAQRAAMQAQAAAFGGLAGPGVGPGAAPAVRPGLGGFAGLSAPAPAPSRRTDPPAGAGR
jgi:signal recognition particle subunit SRP54